MPVPSPRNKILPARGNYVDLAANVASLLDGEICYAIDQDQYYQNEGGALVSVGATKDQGALADTSLQPGDNVSTLTNDAGYITLAEVPGDLVTSVAGKTGDVTLVKADIADFNEADYATAAQGVTADSATQPLDNVSTLTNDAGYITLGEVPGDLVTSVQGRTGDVTITKTDLSIENVDNTSDANKPVSTAQQTALDAKADLVGGFIPTSQIPAIAITEFLGSVGSEAAMLALVGQPGDWCLRTDKAVGYVITGADPSLAADWEAFTVPGSAVTTINSQVGDVVLGFADVGAASAAQGALADTATQPGDNVSTLTNDAGYITATGTYWTEGTNQLYPATATNNVLIGGTLPSSPNIRLNANGSAEFGTDTNKGAILLNGPQGSGNRATNALIQITAEGPLAGNSDDTIWITEAKNDGSLQFDSWQGNAWRTPYAVSFSKTGGISANGSVSIGGTLPSSPNIELNADGSIVTAADATINTLTVGLGGGSVTTNTTVGRDALSNNTTGNNNTAVGNGPLFSNTTGIENTALGRAALYNNTEGNSNAALGRQALFSNTTGSENVALGRRAGYYIEGSNNTILGAYVGTSADSTLSDTVIISAGRTERMRIDNSGRLLLGTSSSRNVGHTQEAAIQTFSSVPSQAAFTFGFNNTAGTILALAKSRSSAIGTRAIVNDSDKLGEVRFAGDDGVDLESIGASIRGEVDGTPGANDMPGRLVFSTTADGASDPTERLRIDSSGKVGIGTASPGTNFHLNNNPSWAAPTGGIPNNTQAWISSGVYTGLGLQGSSAGASYLLFADENDGDAGYFSYDHSADSMLFGVNAAERARIDSSGDVLIGGTLPSSPNITLNANGSAAFVGKIEVGARQTDSPSGQGALVNSTGTIMSQRPSGQGTSPSWQGWLGTSTTSQILANGSAEFAGVVSAKSSLYVGPSPNIQLFSSGSSKFGGSISIGTSISNADINTTLNANGSATFTGSVSIGGTAAANTIDEYEEGTWTPNVLVFGPNTPVSFTVTNANYVRIGSQVTMQCTLQLDASSNGVTYQLLFYGHTIFGNPKNRSMGLITTNSSVEAGIGYSSGTNFTFRGPAGTITCGAVDTETLTFSTTFIIT